ncbi:hypothetical protein OG548_14260 [Streptomyces sp. NBC_01356]|uniref:hypothetical protein n=1 Tax=Streptomyces sp. NBC_01356 TaxID=2903836 RepID=UPI002E37EF7D|nr:hypothetical protein [Streptomyces sp. NBC_01356]
MSASSQTSPPTPSPLNAAVGVIQAEMREGDSSAFGIAAAEQSAGILFDAEHIEAVASAARDQAAAEARAEADDLREQLATLVHFKRQYDGIRALLAGRPDDDTMLVREIVAAAEGRNPREGVPLVLTWMRSVDLPYSGRSEARVRCTTSHGAPALLTLTREERLALASLLDAEIRDIHEKGAPTSCGSATALDEREAQIVGGVTP